MRLAVDTGGTFTDLVVHGDDERSVRMFKSATTSDNPVRGILDVLRIAADHRGVDLATFLGEATMLIHGTTRAINAVITGTTARTAFLSTEGHRDVLYFREGGRAHPFDFSHAYPEPYVPRHLTFEIPERIGSRGEVARPLDEVRTRAVLEEVAASGAEAIGVCLLWSTMNPDHELRVGELARALLPDVPVTLSHQLNPILREYRRASSTCIDASLKPVMVAYLRDLEGALESAGFRGTLFIGTSSGGVAAAAEVAAAPILVLGSGPAMAPVAGRYFAHADADLDTAVVADTGGTTYDVSLVRRDAIPRTDETWLGDPYVGHMTGFPSVDVRSIGAGGGSIGWVDEGGMLHVGPQSAGADPGPACYGRGNTEPTVTDASLVLGHLDPAHFLGGAMRLDLEAARTAVGSAVAEPLGLSIEDAAAAMLELATEHMVHAIEEITINQGIDPADAVLIGGGGAAGLNSVAIARRLGFASLVIPYVGAALSAAGALLSELTHDFAATYPASSDRFDHAGVDATLARLETQASEFVERAGATSGESRIDYFANVRYPGQIWELDVPLSHPRVAEPADVAVLAQSFHDLHEDIFAVSDREAPIEILGWRSRGVCRLADVAFAAPTPPDSPKEQRTRSVHIPGEGAVDVRVVDVEQVPDEATIAGPAIIESSFTTVVLEHGSVAQRTAAGSLLIHLS